MNNIISAISIFLSFLVLLPHNIKALDTNSVKYYPLSVGNVYIYKYTKKFASTIVTQFDYKVRINSAVVIGNHKWFYHSYFPQAQPDAWIYVDSTSGELVNLTCGLEDSLAADINDEYFLTPLRDHYQELIKDSQALVKMCEQRYQFTYVRER